MNASWKDNQGILSWKVLPRKNCKLLPDQGLKLLRKSLGLSMLCFSHSTALLQVEVLTTHNSPFFPLSVMNPSSSLVFPMPLSHPRPAQGGCTAPDEQRNVTKNAWNRSLYIIYSAFPDECYGNRKFQGTLGTLCAGLDWKQLTQLSLLSENF